jgi:hypothetical protein
MSNNITLKKSSVADKVPLSADLQFGELALNYADGNLFYKSSSNVVTTLASNKFVSVTGNVTGGNVSTGNLTASGSTTLSSLISNSTVNFNSASNVSLGSISNIKISGGTANYVLQTDGASNLSWVAQSGGGGTPGGANTQIQFNDGGTFGGDAGLAFNKTTTTLTANNIVAASSANLGLVNNVVISGGSNGYVLSTNGSGTLSWIQPAEPASITVDNFVGNGVQTVFTLSTTPSSVNNTFINYNGATLLRDAYSLTGANVTFDSAPAAGSQLEITTLGLTAGGGGGGGAIDGVFYENNANVAASYTISSGKNAMTTGPVTINTGVTVTVPTGSRWVIL